MAKQTEITSEQLSAEFLRRLDRFMGRVDSADEAARRLSRSVLALAGILLPLSFLSLTIERKLSCPDLLVGVWALLAGAIVLGVIPSLYDVVVRVRRAISDQYGPTRIDSDLLDREAETFKRFVLTNAIWTSAALAMVFVAVVLFIIFGTANLPR